MAQGGLIPALIWTEQAVFEENEVKSTTAWWYTVLLQWEDFSQVDASSFSTEIPGRSHTVTWKWRLQYSCRHRGSLWLHTGHTLCAGIGHFTQFQERFCLFTLPYLLRSWVRTIEMELFTHFIDLYQHSLENKTKKSTQDQQSRIIQVQWILQKKSFLFRKTQLW